MVSRSFLSVRIEKLYHNHIVSRVVPTLAACVERELYGMETVLDIGCGPNSPVARLHVGRRLTGLEGDYDAAEQARKTGAYENVVHADLRTIDFPEKSFDAVVLLEVIEHLSRQDGEILLENAKRWTKHKVIISTPNGFWPQGDLYGNHLQRHLSGWTVDDLEMRGVQIKGLAGLRLLRKENKGLPEEGVTPLAATLRWSPWQISFVLAVVSQVFTYHLPKYAFELFGVWERAD